MIVVGVMYIAIYMLLDQKSLNHTVVIDSPISNIHGRTSRRIYRLVLPLVSPEMLSLLSKSSILIFLYSAHLALFSRMDDTITRTNASVSIVIWN